MSKAEQNEERYKMFPMERMAVMVTGDNHGDNGADDGNDSGDYQW